MKFSWLNLFSIISMTLFVFTSGFAQALVRDVETTAVRSAFLRDCTTPFSKKSKKLSLAGQWWLKGRLVGWPSLLEGDVILYNGKPTVVVQNNPDNDFSPKLMRSINQNGTLSDPFLVGEHDSYYPNVLRFAQISKESDAVKLGEYLEAPDKFTNEISPEQNEDKLDVGAIVSFYYEMDRNTALSLAKKAQVELPVELINGVRPMRMSRGRVRTIDKVYQESLGLVVDKEGELLTIKPFHGLDVLSGKNHTYEFKTSDFNVRRGRPTGPGQNVSELAPKLLFNLQNGEQPLVEITFFNEINYRTRRGGYIQGTLVGLNSKKATLVSVNTDSLDIIYQNGLRSNVKLADVADVSRVEEFNKNISLSDLKYIAPGTKVSFTIKEAEDSYEMDVYGYFIGVVNNEIIIQRKLDDMPVKIPIASIKRRSFVIPYI